MSDGTSNTNNKETNYGFEVANIAWFPDPERVLQGDKNGTNSATGTTGAQVNNQSYIVADGSFIMSPEQMLGKDLVTLQLKEGKGKDKREDKGDKESKENQAEK